MTQDTKDPDMVERLPPASEFALGLTQKRLGELADIIAADQPFNREVAARILDAAKWHLDALQRIAHNAWIAFNRLPRTNKFGRMEHAIEVAKAQITTALSTASAIEARRDVERLACSALEASHHAELVSVLRELVYGGGGHVWAHARELLAKMDGGQ